MSGDLYLCGAGNVEGIRLALTVQRAEPARWQRVVLLDDDPEKIGKTILGLEVAGPLSMLAEADGERDSVVNLVTRKTASRWTVMEKIQAYGIPFATLVHPSVDLFGTTLSQGATVYQDVILGAGCTLDVGAVILVRAVVGHGARVGRGCVVAPGAVVNARVELGERAYIGSNAAILPDLCIGADATVGALTSVIQDVPAKATAIGVPAKILVVEVDHDEEPSAENEEEADTELIQQLATIWQEVLGLAVKPNDSFFDLGGNSLQVFKVCHQVEESLGIRVTPGEVFRFLTVRKLAAHVGRGGATSVDRGQDDRHARRKDFFASRRKRRAR